MPAYKDKVKGTWYASFYYENWKGEKEKKLKRGFKTKREALEWERTFQQQKASNLDMTFFSFVEVYSKDMEVRLKQNTWLTKKHIIETKLLPAFGGKRMNDIRPADIDITYNYAHLFPTRQTEMAEKLDCLRTEEGA